MLLTDFQDLASGLLNYSLSAGVILAIALIIARSLIYRNF